MELCNLFFHSSQGVTQGDRRGFDPDSGAGYSLRRKGPFTVPVINQTRFRRVFGTVVEVFEHAGLDQKGAAVTAFSGPDATWGLLQRDVKSIRQLAHRQ